MGKELTGPALCFCYSLGTGSLACWFFSALATVIGVFCSWWTVYSGLYNAVKTSGHTWSYGKCVSYTLTQLTFPTLPQPLSLCLALSLIRSMTLKDQKIVDRRGEMIGKMKE